MSSTLRKSDHHRRRLRRCARPATHTGGWRCRPFLRSTSHTHSNMAAVPVGGERAQRFEGDERYPNPVSYQTIRRSRLPLLGKTFAAARLPVRLEVEEFQCFQSFQSPQRRGLRALTAGGHHQPLTSAQFTHHECRETYRGGQKAFDGSGPPVRWGGSPRHYSRWCRSRYRCRCWPEPSTDRRPPSEEARFQARL